jgi:hypothetical protein
MISICCVSCIWLLFLLITLPATALLQLAMVRFQDVHLVTLQATLLFQAKCPGQGYNITQLVSQPTRWLYHAYGSEITRTSVTVSIVVIKLCKLRGQELVC